MLMLTLVANYGVCLHMSNAGSKIIFNMFNVGSKANAVANANVNAYAYYGPRADIIHLLVFARASANGKSNVDCIANVSAHSCANDS